MTRQALQVCVVALFVTASLAACVEPESPPRLIRWAVSLQEDTQNVCDAEKIIVIFVSQYDCEFCALLRRQVLFPLIRSGELDERVELREVSLDADFELIDFNGTAIKGKRFADRYNAYVTPTLLFLDNDGTSLTEPLVGTGNIEFYSFYLDKKISEATQALLTH